VVIYLQEQRGLSLGEAALIDVTFFVAAAIGEVPTGIVADTWGRKSSLAIGCILMAASSVGWVFAPTLPLIILAYVCLGIGYTFISGAEDALFYESTHRAGREGEYTRLVGRAGATMTASLALGSVASGLLASIALMVPFLVAAGCYVVMFGIVLTFQEPPRREGAEGEVRKPFTMVIAQAMTLMRSRPTVRYPIIYLAVVPLAALILETLFVQPQAIVLNVPVAGVGFVVMGLQVASMAGAVWSDRLGRRFGEVAVVYAVPFIIVVSLAFLSAFQVKSALLHRSDQPRHRRTTPDRHQPYPGPGSRQRSSDPSLGAVFDGHRRCRDRSTDARCDRRSSRTARHLPHPGRLPHPGDSAPVLEGSSPFRHASPPAGH
jgi:MFS family permease